MRWICWVVPMGLWAQTALLGASDKPSPTTKAAVAAAKLADSAVKTAPVPDSNAPKAAAPAAPAAPPPTPAPPAPGQSAKAPTPAAKPVSPAEAMRAAVELQRASVAIQKESVKKQAEALGLRMKPWEPASSTVPGPAFGMTANCDPLPDAEVRPLIARAAQETQLDTSLLNAVVEQESGFKPCAVSSRGAMGMMQIMPQTATELSLADPFNPGDNVSAGAKYLKQLLGRYGDDLSKALAAYNSGPGTVDSAGGVPDIPETQDYVTAILTKLGKTALTKPPVAKSAPNPAAPSPAN